MSSEVHISSWSVGQLAKRSGVSVRTLHHYHAIGLLSPASVGANGYRHCGRDEQLRLQQILFFREMRLSLGLGYHEGRGGGGSVAKIGGSHR